MAQARISKRTVDALQPKEGGNVILWDTNLRGFGVRCSAAGTKTYVFKYQRDGRRGRQRWYKIGRHGRITPAQARAEAERLAAIVELGEDPAEVRSKRNVGDTIKAAIETFLTEHVEAKRKPATAEHYRSLARLYVIPDLGRLLVTDVKLIDIERLHGKLADRPYQANRLLAMMRKFFNWSEDRAIRPRGSNPCKGIEQYSEQRRERFLSQDEIGQLGTALRAAEEANSITPSAAAAIRLLLLTGCRRDEILKLRWEDVDIERRLLLLPDSKTGKRAVMLNEPAQDVLSRVPRVKGNPFVIVGKVDGAHLVNLSKPWQRVRDAAMLEGVRVHDLRHSFASVAAAGGESLIVIGALLGHREMRTTARYAHLSSNPLRTATDMVGERISKALDASDASADASGSEQT